ncbi:MAG: CRISPR-associated endonuclease Cas6 [Fidelibacterota bacterium]
MEFTYPEVKTIVVRLITDKPVRKTPYQVKGVFMRHFPEESIVPMLDGTYRDHFLYPRVQVKILNEQIYVVGIGEGVDSIRSMAEKLDILDFGNITFQVHDVDVEEHTDNFHPVPKLIRYRFVTPWVALNQTTGSRYRFLNNVDRVNFLNRLLGQNIVFMAREMGMELEENIFTKVTLTSLFPKPVDENNWGAFEGEFRANFVLPNYIGIGNGITRGYGTVFGLFNPELFTFDEQVLESTLKGKIDEEPPLVVAESGIQEIEIDKVPRPRKNSNRNKPKKKSKKVLSEEFDIEDENPPVIEAVPPVKPRRKSKKRKESSDESKFNSEEYHKKQHNL